ncbi:hypothetical protein FHW79_003401 [Azospirillum sp. OGB3]|nr:hypothetical protein [Azospirillum sp. OGB3]
MPRHRLLPDTELRQLLGIPADRDALARRFTLTPSDQDLVLTRRGAANRLGFAVQLALLRHSGRALAQIEEPLDALVAWIATQIHVPAHLFTDYARRPQTMTDHARQLAAMLGLRPSTNLDLPFMIEAAAQAAWTTNRPEPIVTAIVSGLRSQNFILPALPVIERTGAAGRARARKRAVDALLAGLTDEQLAELDRLPVVDPDLGGAPSRCGASVSRTDGAGRQPQFHVWDVGFMKKGGPGWIHPILRLFCQVPASLDLSLSQSLSETSQS